MRSSIWRPVYEICPGFSYRNHKDLVSEQLETIGLRLKPSKTRICHTLDDSGGDTGFDFLGFHVRQFRVGKTKSGRSHTGQLLGFKTIITPSKEAMKRHYQTLCRITDGLRAARQEALIAELNPVIRGWANYYSTKCSKRAFSRLDCLLMKKLSSWATSRHPNKGKRWAMDMYWRVGDGEGWVFRPRNFDGRLIQHKETPIRRHPKVQADRSPYDGDWIYWGARTGR